MTDFPKGTILVGAGVVGQAILRAHVASDQSVTLADLDGDRVDSAIQSLDLGPSWTIDPSRPVGDSMVGISIRHVDGTNVDAPTIVIESIAERLDVKRSFFGEAERLFGDDAILCSNTSTLRITDIAAQLRDPSRMAGMHFFMPVDRRPAVEVIRGESTSDDTIHQCTRHVGRLGKEPLVVADSPGFIVNRLLSPYLNQAMLLLCGGIPADRIEAAALAYGMPMSPLELVDMIGARTTFDSGRVYWQSFPQRIDPAPILGKMIKSKRLGRSVGQGFYDYTDDQRSLGLAAETLALADTYFRPIGAVSDTQLQQLLSIPMLIEAAITVGEGTVTQTESLDTAMRGGLGFQSDRPWLQYFDTLGSPAIRAAIDRWQSRFKAMNCPAPFADQLAARSPSMAIVAMK
ncbi:Fatty acid oxidation complex subunit alpha [Rubripirellula lacrimiformis]|uniref:Fatty acid oxidation complex subunit alpha n=1 Tax=Rubripirellula lacrimiformis TaxID=1930273 RepID=A0A517N786_9BACT|nr:3-hydroxyacyl-CoA dehydrogenase family protein [Rubripirellula lacrimiformis]QDT02981.1 Fatty acid oxidation complex subunit alpha [Rubripirellula lacrimiformis]